MTGPGYNLAAFQIAYALGMPVDEVKSWPLTTLREWLAFSRWMDRQKDNG